MQSNLSCSPCLTCTSVQNPGNCENKNCVRWRNWFIGRWERLRTYPRMQMEQTRGKPEAVRVGGTDYILPHRVREYLGENPCKKCLCSEAMCNSPCPSRRAWDSARKEVLQ